MFDVPHRHAVLILPDRLRPVLKGKRDQRKVIKLLLAFCLSFVVLAFISF